MIIKKILITISALIAINLIPVVSAEEITLEKLNSRTKVLEGNLDMRTDEIKKLKKNKSVKVEQPPQHIKEIDVGPKKEIAKHIKKQEKRLIVVLESANLETVKVHNQY